VVGAAAEDGRRRGQAAGMGGARGGRRYRGGRALWVAGIGPGSSCRGDQEVRAARNLPATRKLRRRLISPAAVTSQNPNAVEDRGIIAGLGKLPGDAAERTRALSGSGRGGAA
jgi:hypothetical protein